MPITDWPEDERPRERLLQQGARALSDAELLAIFLRTGIKGKTALDLAQELLDYFRGLRGLLSASQAEFCQPKGLGVAKYVQLQATLELSRRYLAEHLQRGEALSNPDITRQYLVNQLRSRPQEVFACLFLDTRHHVLCFEELFYGTLDNANVYPREVARRALQHNAAAVIFAHNHPSGIAEPSQSDINITHRLKEALALIEVRVLDHFVIGDSALSFAERGLL